MNSFNYVFSAHSVEHPQPPRPHAKSEVNELPETLRLTASHLCTSKVLKSVQSSAKVTGSCVHPGWVPSLKQTTWLSSKLVLSWTPRISGNPNNSLKNGPVWKKSQLRLWRMTRETSSIQASRKVSLRFQLVFSIQQAFKSSDSDINYLLHTVRA